LCVAPDLNPGARHTVGMQREKAGRSYKQAVCVCVCVFMCTCKCKCVCELMCVSMCVFNISDCVWLCTQGCFLFVCVNTQMLPCIFISIIAKCTCSYTHLQLSVPVCVRYDWSVRGYEWKTQKRGCVLLCPHFRPDISLYSHCQRAVTPV